MLLIERAHLQNVLQRSPTMTASSVKVFALFLCILYGVAISTVAASDLGDVDGYNDEYDDTNLNEPYDGEDDDDDIEIDHTDDDDDDGDEKDDDAPVGDEFEHNYIVEVLAVIDEPMYKKWLNAAGAGTHERVVEEVKSFFLEVNMVYQSLRAYNMSIEIRLKDIVFADGSIMPAEKIKGKNIVDKMQLSYAFSRWLRNNNYKSGSFDHAMYITAYDIKGTSLRVAGSAVQNAVCKVKGTSRVEGRLTGDVIRTAAHEIGHSLGAHHDDAKNKACRYYVMHPSGFVGNRQRWYFSKCSAANFKWALGRRGPNSCLKRTTSPPIVAKRWGERVGKNNWCKRFFGYKVSHAYNWGDKLCNSLVCSNGKRYTYKVSTPEGMSCGTDKQCFKGHCV